MLKEHATVFRKSMIFADLCIVVLSFFSGYYLRNSIQPMLPLRTYIILLPIIVFIWGGLLYFFGMYRSFRIRRASEVFLIVLKAAITGFLFFSSYIYIFKIQDVSRAFIISVFILAIFFIVLEKGVLLALFRILRKSGFNCRGILIVGTGRRAQQFIDLIHKHAEWGLRIIGLVDEDSSHIGKTINGCKVLGIFKDIPWIIEENVVDEVVFVVPRSWLQRIEGAMHFCETVGIKVSVAVDYFRLKFTKGKQADLDGFPLLSFGSAPDRIWHLLLKRLFDMVFTSLGLVLLSPLFLIIAIAVKCTSNGPVFFKQERCSLNGRRFALYKFRTMVEGAEAKIEELLQHNEMKGPVFKMENDPRLTKIGKYLRKLSLDELPQIWNVLKGDMSLVGPRPPLPAEVKKYDDWQRRRLSMRPGITCIWQASGRNKISDFNHWMKLDLEYIDNWSLTLDFKILCKTVPAVLFVHGAK